MDSSHAYFVDPLLTVRVRERAMAKKEEKEKWLKVRITVVAVVGDNYLLCGS